MDPIVCKWAECGLLLQRHEDLDFHWLQHFFDDPTTCRWAGCAHEFPSGQTIEGKMLHIRQAHTSHRPYECQECERRFVAESFLKLHQFRVHEQKKNLCLCPYLDCNFSSGKLTDLGGHCVEVHGIEGLKSLIKVLDGEPGNLLFPNDIGKQMESAVPVLKKLILKSILDTTSTFDMRRSIKSDPVDLPVNLVNEPFSTSVKAQPKSPISLPSERIVITPVDTKEFIFPITAEPTLPSMSTCSSSVCSSSQQPPTTSLAEDKVDQANLMRTSEYYMNFLLSAPPLPTPTQHLPNPSTSSPEKPPSIPPTVEEPQPHVQQVQRGQTLYPPLPQVPQFLETHQSEPDPSNLTVVTERRGVYNACRIEFRDSHRIIQDMIEIPTSPVNLMDPRLQYSYYQREARKLMVLQQKAIKDDPRLKRNQPGLEFEKKRSKFELNTPEERSNTTRRVRSSPSAECKRSSSSSQTKSSGSERESSVIYRSPEYKPRVVHQNPSNYENEKSRRSQERSDSPRSRDRYDSRPFRGKDNIRNGRRGQRNRSISYDRSCRRGFRGRRDSERSGFTSRYALSPQYGDPLIPTFRSHGEDREIAQNR